MLHARGFTLIEVLISMVILAIGLLGLAAMQAVSLRDNLDSYNYQQATLLAYEMQDRIRGNSEVDDWLSVTPSYSETACTKSAPCTAQQMAQNDFGYWEKSVKETLPNPANASTKMVEIQLSSSVNKAGCKGTYATSLCLITTWARASNKDSSKAVKLDSEAHFYLEVTP